MNESFELYDLKIEVHQNENKSMICNHKKGSHFFLYGESIVFPKNITFPIYCLASLIPILPVKQRQTDPADWVSTDEYIACPDPNCGGLFKIIRLPKKRIFNHKDVTIVPMKKN